MPHVKIRQATFADLKLLTKLAYTTFWDAFHDHPKNAPHDLADYMSWAFSQEQVAKELSDHNSLFLIAEVDGDMAGYAKLIFESTEPDIIAEWPVELNRLYSHQKYLGQGVGQALMDACFDRARQTGRDVMWLGVWEHNPRAQRFYEKNGFRYVGKHTFLLGSDPQTDLLMQKRLDISAKIDIP
jgi:ribosomal protein S18 acetylase RimI-like enzyme